MFISKKNLKIIAGQRLNDDVVIKTKLKNDDQINIVHNLRGGC